jgi:glutaconate CoA-transferase subunit B
MKDLNIKKFEMMLYVASKEIKDNMVVFAGFHWPMIITRIARRLHAKNLKIVYENGIVEYKNTLLTPTSPSDLISSLQASFFGDSIDSLFIFLPKVDLAVLDAPNLDKYGNVNTTCVGDYFNPKVRLPGAGGGTELSSLSKKLLIVTSAEGKKRFPEIVDYITSPGYIKGNKQRDKLGYKKNTGPYALMTTLGKFLFDSKTKEIYLHSYYPMVKIDEIKENFSWKIKIPRNVKKINLPNEKEIKVVREEIKNAKKRLYIIPDL